MTDCLTARTRELSLCAVVVTFHPNSDVAENLRAIVRECGRALVVDNGSTRVALAALEEIPGVTLIRQEKNIGLAAALNVGAARAAELGCTWVVTFDQDSRPDPGTVAAMWETHIAVPEAALIGPRIHEENSNVAKYCWICRQAKWPFVFRRERCSGVDLPDVMMTITSGSMMEIETWSRLRGFDEALFIDYIDTDYCLRVIRSGRRVAVSSRAMLQHRMGARQRRVIMGLAFRPTHHAAFRHYYIARNRVRLWRRHAAALPHWAMFDLCFAGYNGFRVLAFESERGKKLKAMALGTWDGIRGRFGPNSQGTRF